MRGCVLVIVPIVTIAFGMSGCRSCGKASEEVALTTPPTVPKPVATIVEPVPSETDQVPAGEIPPPEGRLVEKVASMPAAFWNLPIRKYVLTRAKTTGLGRIKPSDPNPRQWPAMTLAVLDLAGGGEHGDVFNKEVDELYRHLVEQRVFTAALPFLVFWNAFEKGRPTEWSVAVPVAEGTEVKPPLTLRHLPASKVHRESITPTEAMRKFGPTTLDNRLTPADILRTIGVNMQKQLRLTTKPALAIVRFPEIVSGPLHMDSVFELLFLEPLAEDRNLAP